MAGALIALVVLGVPPPLEATSRSGVELRDAVREALPRWARPKDEDAERAAVEFLVLYEELQKDDRLADSQREYLKTKVRLRLLDLGEQISKRIAREKRLAKNKAKGEDPLPASIDLPQHKGEPLAQNVGVANFAAGFGSAGFGRRGGQGNDYGPQLVDLIQRTVAPMSWDVNGGPGSIDYWVPGRAIVVRQTDAVHEDIGGLLRQLERANR